MQDTWQTLLPLAKNGDASALAMLCSDFAPLVRASVRHYPGRYKDEEDLLQEGFISLLEAITTFDASRGVFFPHYAQERVRQGIYKAVRQTESRLKHIEANMPDNWETYLWDPHHDPSANHDVMARIEWSDLFDELSPRERLFAVMGLLKGWTVRDLALHCGVGVETVKTWKKRTVKKLRKALCDNTDDGDDQRPRRR